MPTNSIIPWMGSKRLLRKTIAQFVPDNIGKYIEPFGGAYWLLLYKDRWAKTEVYNDLDERLTNLFLQVKYHPEALIIELEKLPAGRIMFGKMMQWEGLTELQKAARFFYVITFSFGAQGDSFGARREGAQKSLRNKLDAIRALSKRLDHVQIEGKDYKDLIKYYDSPSAFFYFDPPYVTGARYDNAREFDHKAFRDCLRTIKGKWLLSLDDCPEARELFAEFPMIPLSRQKGIVRTGDLIYKELLIGNWDFSPN